MVFCSRQIASAVVEDDGWRTAHDPDIVRDLDWSAYEATGDYKLPFVEGTPEARGSGSTASRSARAVALKIVSIM